MDNHDMYYDAYEGTIFDYMCCYYSRGIGWFGLENNQKLQSFLTQLLKVDINKQLENAKELNARIFTDEDSSRMATIFNAITKYAYIRLMLNDLVYKDDHYPSDLASLHQAFHVLASINNDLSIILPKGEVLFDTLLADESYIMRAQYLLSILIDEYDNTDVYQIVSILIQCAAYEINKEAEALYLVITLSMIHHSWHFTDEIRDIANELLRHFLFLLKNGSVIDYRINRRKPQMVPQAERARSDDTTQLCLLYSYSNFDAYYLRLDFAHIGQDYMHFNNISPAGIECNLFTKEEYNQITKKYPSIERCFIEEGTQYAILEQMRYSIDDNCVLKSICDENKHKQVFSKEFDEGTVLQFVQLLSYMVESSHHKTIDTNGEYARVCFQYNKVLYMAFLWAVGVECNQKKLIDYSMGYFGKLAKTEGITDMSNYDLIAYTIEHYKDILKKI